jgi:flagellar biosynthesis anti-sigma factor FlgM
MKIDNSVIGAYQRAGVGPVAPKAPAPAPAPVASQDSSTSSQAAKVTISAEARALAKTADVPVDQQKVDALKSKIQAGEFKVDSHAVARRLLDKLA